jgi:hypothetical protein
MTTQKKVPYTEMRKLRTTLKSRVTPEQFLSLIEDSGRCVTCGEKLDECTCITTDVDRGGGVDDSVIEEIESGDVTDEDLGVGAGDNDEDALRDLAGHHADVANEANTDSGNDNDSTTH